MTRKASPQTLVFNPSLALHREVSLSVGADVHSISELPFDDDAARGLRLFIDCHERLIDKSLVGSSSSLNERVKIETRQFLEWAVPGKGLQTLELIVSSESHQELVKLARVLAKHHGRLDAADVQMNKETFELLRSEGMLLRASLAPRRVIVDLRLSADDSQLNPPTSAMTVNKRVRPFTKADEKSPAHGLLQAANIQPDRANVLMVTQPETRVVLPVTLSDSDLEAWQRSSRGQDTLSRQTASRFASAGLLVPKYAAGYAAKAANALAQNRFVVLPRVISEFHAARLRDYCCRSAEQGWLRKGDFQSQRWVRSYDLAIKSVQLAMEPLISRIAVRHWRPCKSSFCYVGVYNRGDVLPRHQDRDQCRWNISLCFGSEPAQACYPIYLETETGIHEVNLRPGDCLLYSGKDTWHWRDHFTTGQMHAACFLFYVDEDFEGTLL